MNIVVVGGGEPGKFGNDFCNLAKQEGHNVFILSHKEYKTADPRHTHADFRKKESVIEEFNKLTSSIDHIDIFIFNGWCNCYPSCAHYFTSHAEIDIQSWHENLDTTVVLPHLLSIEALKKMSIGSKIVFLTTKMALEFERTNYTEMAGYAGIKAAQTHLMIALAHHNDKGVIVSSISPHFPYEDRESYNRVFIKGYKYILSFDKSRNGCIEYISS